MMRKIFTLLGGLSLFGSVALVGCHSDSNKLLTADKDQAAQFIYKAQAYATEKTRLYDLTGSAYVTCIQNPAHFDNPFIKNAQNPCGAFLVTMVEYAKQSKGFSDVTLSDLKDPDVAKRLNDAIFSYQSTGGQSGNVQ